MTARVCKEEGMGYTAIKSPLTRTEVFPLLNFYRCTPIFIMMKYLMLFAAVLTLANGGETVCEIPRDGNFNNTDESIQIGSQPTCMPGYGLTTDRQCDSDGLHTTCINITASCNITHSDGVNRMYLRFSVNASIGHKICEAGYIINGTFKCSTGGVIIDENDNVAYIGCDAETYYWIYAFWAVIGIIFTASIVLLLINCWEHCNGQK